MRTEAERREEIAAAERLIADRAKALGSAWIGYSEAKQVLAEAVDADADKYERRRLTQRVNRAQDAVEHWDYYLNRAKGALRWAKREDR